MWDKFLLCIFLFLVAIVTVHIVSWIGSIMHSVPNGGNSEYAVFTFRSDQNKPMTTNILMNVIIPNVCLIFLHLLFYTYNEVYDFDSLIYYVIFYYLYRAILILVILRRKELLNIVYEGTNALSGVLIAYFLTKYFLRKPTEIFIPVAELVNEFWLVIIIIVYNFICLLLGKVFTQKNVVSEEMLDKYIIKMFNNFYDKYKNVICISKEDNMIWILLFSIMIFENYNRGTIKRKIEKLKINFGKCATVGIMQIKSNKNISDEESISLAYKKLKDEIVGNDVEIDDEMQIKYYASQYNPDEDYAKSISFIYQHLKEYLILIPRYQKVFYLDERMDAKTFNDNPYEETETYVPTEVVYFTLDDIVEMSGLTKKQVKKKIKKKNMVVLLYEEEVKKVFKKYF